MWDRSQEGGWCTRVMFAMEIIETHRSQVLAVGSCNIYIVIECWTVATNSSRIFKHFIAYS